MWYVLQVQTGREENICIQCRKMIPASILHGCFSPHYEEKRKVQGSWTVREKILFPGYVFVISDRLDEMREAFRKVNGLTKLLTTGNEIVPLTEREVEFIQSFLDEGEALVKMSTGIQTGSQITVLSGPLQGKEAYICKIDRHKRKAWLEVELFGRRQRVEAGLEVVEKR